MVFLTAHPELSQSMLRELARRLRQLPRRGAADDRQRRRRNPDQRRVDRRLQRRRLALRCLDHRLHAQEGRAVGHRAGHVRALRRRHRRTNRI